MIRIFPLLALVLSGCFIANPYKEYKVGVTPDSVDCHGAKHLLEKGIPHACLYFESEPESGGTIKYLLLDSANGVSLSGAKAIKGGAQSLALPAGYPVDLSLLNVGVRPGFGSGY